MTAPHPFDILLRGKGYMLARAEQLGRGGRAWQVSSQGASIARRTERESRYGNQPSNIDLPVVWESYHLGYGDERQVREGRYHYATNIDARFPEMLLPGPHITTVSTGFGNVTAFAEISGRLLFLAGRFVGEFTAADSIVQERDLGAGKVGVDMEVFNNNLFVGLGFGAGDFVHRRTAAGVWLQDNDVRVGHMTITKDRLCAQVSERGVAWVQGDDDPMDITRWSATYRVGENTSSITALSGLDELLYIGKADGLYAMDDDGIAPALTPELRAYQHIDNCRNLRPWHGTIWVPHIRGLLECQSLGEQGNVMRSAQPARDSLGENPVRGRITALAGDDRWLYASLHTTSGDTYILAGREAGEADLGRLIWHPLARIVGQRCDTMHISGLWPSPRLFLGLGTSVAYIILPRHTDNPLTDANCRYAMDGDIYYSTYDWMAPTASKVFRRITLEADGLSPTRHIGVYYRLDNGVWTYVGQANVSPQHTLSLGPQGIEGQRIELRLNMRLNGTMHPLVLHRVIVQAAERPATVEVIRMVIRCADGLRRNDGTPERRSGAEMLSELRTLPHVGKAVPLVDVIGSVRQVLVQAPIDEQETEKQAGESREVLATLHATCFDAAATDYERFDLSLGGGTGSGTEVPLAMPWEVALNNIDSQQVHDCRARQNVGPVISIIGPILSPVITNVTLNQRLDFTGVTIAAGNAYTIDMSAENKTVKDEMGIDRSGQLAPSSNLHAFVLVPGPNQLRVTGSNVTVDSRVSIGYVVAQAN